MNRARLSFVVLIALGCSPGPISVGDDRRADAGGAADASAGADAGNMADAATGSPTAAQLLALLQPCAMISNGLLAREAGKPKDVAVCALSSAVYWTSELAVDCDGKRSAICNAQTDPQSQNSTVGKDSTGASLDPALVPFVEVPKPSATFDYEAAGLSMGSVVAVIYKDRLGYGVLGQEQAADVIGAASYAMANQLGIDPDPINGGLQTKDVTYLAFKGQANVLAALEDVAAAAELGQSAASELLAQGR